MHCGPFAKSPRTSPRLPLLSLNNDQSPLRRKLQIKWWATLKKKMRKGEKMIEASLTLEPSICWHIWVGWSWDGDTFRDSKRKLKTQEENKQKGIFLHKNSSFVFFRRRQLRSHTEGFQFSSSSLFFRNSIRKLEHCQSGGGFSLL